MPLAPGRATKGSPKTLQSLVDAKTSPSEGQRPAGPVHCGSLERAQSRADIRAGVWHTLVAMETGTVIFEVKPGPYSPLTDKDFARGAPDEDSTARQPLSPCRHGLVAASPRVLQGQVRVHLPSFRRRPGAGNGPQNARKRSRASQNAITRSGDVWRGECPPLACGRRRMTILFDHWGCGCTAMGKNLMRVRDAPRVRASAVRHITVD